MPPPPTTPSPHRFLLKPPRSSALVPSPLHVSSTPQFNSTPRFKIGISQRDQNAHNPSGEERTCELATLREEILEENDKREDGKNGKDPNLHRKVVYDSIETADGEGEFLFDDDEEEASQVDLDSEINVDVRKLQSYIKRDEVTETENIRSGKRRRMSIASYSSSTHDHEPYHDQESDSDTALPLVALENNSMQPDESTFGDFLPHISSLPPRSNLPSTTSRSTAHPNLPRFLPASTPAPNLTSKQHKLTQKQNLFVKPPRFLPSAPAASNSHAQASAEDELPSAFSPHKRGRKYVAGGLAAEVAGWLLDIGSREAELGSRAEMIRVGVLETNGGRNEGMLILRGRRLEGVGGSGVESERQVRLVLVGDGSGEKAKEVRIGGVIGIKGRGWEVLIEGVRWRVCLKWEVVG